MGNAITGAGAFLLQALLTLATLAALLRFILQAVRADFYNPISQAIVKLTDPVLAPLRRMMPRAGGLDLASLLLALLLQALEIALLRIGPAAAGSFIGITLAAASFSLLVLVLNVYFWALIIVVILSWVAPGTYHPGIALLYQITEPVVAPVRRLVPPVGGLDFSVLVVFLLLAVVRDFLLPGMLHEIGIPTALVY